MAYFTCGRREIGITLQVILYTANSILWIISILAFTCGFVIGLSNDTIRVVDFNILDLAVTTPATAFIIYGLLLTIVTIVGCFSSISARIFISVIYLLLIFFYILFDLFGGFVFLFRENSLYHLYQSLNSSLQDYGSATYKPVGIIPLSPFVYWEHLQKRGKCCGLESFENWRNMPYAKKDADIPDSCCNEEYDYRGCGKYIFKHPNVENHAIDDMLQSKGCLHIFPEALRLITNNKVTFIGFFTASLLILCGVLTLVIIILVACKRFNPEQGLDNPDFKDIEDKSKKKVMHKSHSDDENFWEKRQQSSDSTPIATRKRHSLFEDKKVYPEQEDGDKRRRRHSIESHNRERLQNKVLFRESGPEFIPEGLSDTNLDMPSPTHHINRHPNHHHHWKEEIRRIDKKSVESIT